MARLPERRRRRSAELELRQKPRGLGVGAEKGGLEFLGGRWKGGLGGLLEQKEGGEKHDSAILLRDFTLIPAFLRL